MNKIDRPLCSAIIAMVSLWFCFVATPAHAVDPQCILTDATGLPTDPTEPPVSVAVIDATSGEFFYCAPRIDGNGNLYPATGYPMTCEVRWLSVVLDRQTDLAPGQAVTVAGSTLNWGVDPLEIACSNSKGEGVALLRPALFPAALPGQAYVPGP